MESWGKEIYGSNIKQDDSAKRARQQFGAYADEGDTLNDILSRMTMDKDVNMSTLGQPLSNVTPEAIVMAVLLR